MDPVMISNAISKHLVRGLKTLVLAAAVVGSAVRALIDEGRIGTITAIRGSAAAVSSFSKACGVYFDRSCADAGCATAAARYKISGEPKRDISNSVIPVFGHDSTSEA